MKTSKRFVQYIHHGVNVFVREDLKGKHSEFCLCYSCDKFKPLNRDENCPKANMLYNFDVVNDMVTPVWECPDFVEVKN